MTRTTKILATLIAIALFAPTLIRTGIIVRGQNGLGVASLHDLALRCIPIVAITALLSYAIKAWHYRGRTLRDAKSEAAMERRTREIATPRAAPTSAAIQAITRPAALIVMICFGLALRNCYMRFGIDTTLVCGLAMIAFTAAATWLLTLDTRSRGRRTDAHIAERDRADDGLVS